MNAARPGGRWRERVLLGALCLLGMALAARGITDEGAVALDGDMPRYLMNGAFARDYLSDLPIFSPLQYAYRYFARYPALSLGHHPLLPAVAVVPFYWLFGVSVFSARLSIVCAFGVMLFVWFRLIRRIFDTKTATFSTLLLLSTPGIVPLFQTVLSEPLTLCLVVCSVYFMHRYTEVQRASYAAAFAVSVVLSAYAKHLAVLLFPVYAFQFVHVFGWRALLRRSTVLTLTAMGVALVPLIPLTLNYSAFNVMLVTRIMEPGDRLTRSNFARLAAALTHGPFGMTLLLLSAAAVGLISAAVRRDGRVWVFFVWVVSTYIGLGALGLHNGRFYCYWLPAFCALAAAALHTGSRWPWRAATAALLAATILHQGWLIVRSDRYATSGRPNPVGALGYEAAAKFVQDHPLGDTVLYLAAVDTGYFVFFVRKHDPHRQAIVLRADKMLTTSRMRLLAFSNRIQSSDEIAPLLKQFGVGYVVIEDRPYPEGPLTWLTELVKTSDFLLRQRIEIQSHDRRLAGATLSIYEYLARTPASMDASLTMDIPLINDRIDVPLSDLVGARHRRNESVKPSDWER